MRVTVELVKEGRHKCWENGCVHATHPQLYRGVQYVKAPIFLATLYVGSSGGPMIFFACEDHLVNLSENFALAVDTETRALLGFTPAPGR